MNNQLLIDCSMGALWTKLGQAQTPIPPPAVLTGDVAADREHLMDLSHREKADLKRIDAREGAAIDAVRDDKSLAPEQKSEKIAAITKDARKDRAELREKFEARREILRRDYVNDRRDSLQDAYYSRR